MALKRINYVLEAKCAEMTMVMLFPRWTGLKWESSYMLAKVFATREAAENEAVKAALQDPRAIGKIEVVEVPVGAYGPAEA
jgi:hypothetical protein